MSSTDILDGLIPASEKAPKDGPVLDFKIDRKVLEKALLAVFPVIPAKDPRPILTNFHFKVADLDLRVSGSDSVLSVVTHTSILTSQVEGEAIFPATRMLAVVREAEEGDFHIKVNSKKGKLIATIKSAKTSWTIPLMGAEGYPDFSEIEAFGLVEVDRQPFYEALQRVRKAASVDPMRPFLMLIDVVNGKMRASDTYRFQQIKYHFPFDCQIPVRAAHEVSTRLSSSNLEKIEVGQTNAALLFRFGSVLLIAQKVVAKFPDVDEVLLKPTLANDQEFTVDRSALLKAVRRVRITADETNSAVVLSLNEGSVSVEAKDRKGGTAVEVVDAEWNHSPRHVGFNHQHLSDMLSSTNSEKCVFRLGKDLKTRKTPLLMEDAKDGFTAVISQIRVEW